MSSVVAIWIWLCAYLNAVGWGLSALHELNMRGYIVVFALGLGGLFWWQRQTSTVLFPKIHFPKLRWRFRRTFPLAFLVLATLAFIGGALYAPANFDALAYRTPRVLHWLAAEQWEWIHTEFARLNTRSAGFEWLTAPLFLFTGTDRLEFLINIICFFLLPGRIFAVLTRLGVRRRTAWSWMWLFPAGYGYVLQAGSGVNDLFSTVLALAAIEFALRASREQSVGLLWTSGLAAALMTSAKAFNLLLLLPWLIAAAPALKTLLRKPLATLAVILTATVASMLPTALLNAKYCGDWTGATLESTPNGGGHEIVRGFANIGGILISNFQPPIFPFTKQWAEFIQAIIPSGLAKQLHDNMEGGLSRFPTAELMTEESAGLGCGVSLLLALVLLRKIFSPRTGNPFTLTRLCSTKNLVLLGTWFGFFVLIARAGYVGPARYLLPFYILLLVPLLAGAAPEQLTRWCGWKLAGLAVFALALPVLLLSPQRPLWPAATLLHAAGAEHSSNRWLQRAFTVYAVYGSRANGFEPALAQLSPGVTTLGFMGADEPEAALWQPFGSRSIKHICAADSAENIRSRGVKYALVNADFLAHNRNLDFTVWLQQTKAEQLAAVPLKLRAGQPPADWRLVVFPELKN
jgi:hypothetical protein